MLQSMCVRRLFLTSALAVAAISIGIGTCKADDVPAGLLGKTLSVSYAESLQAKDESTGKTITAARSSNLTIYVSSQGRIFVRRNALNNANQQGKFEEAPGSEPYQYRDGMLVAEFHQLSGGGQSTIKISPDFQSCTISVSYAASRRWRSDINGKTFTALGPTQISGEKCSIATGNGL